MCFYSIIKEFHYQEKKLFFVLLSHSQQSSKCKVYLLILLKPFLNFVKPFFGAVLISTPSPHCDPCRPLPYFAPTSSHAHTPSPAVHVSARASPAACEVPPMYSAEYTSREAK
jgi:hypothetical protein